MKPLKQDLLLALQVVIVCAFSVGAAEASDIVPEPEVRVIAAAPTARCCATNAVPAVIAPAYRAFEAKCKDGSVTRGDLIALKRFIAASALDAAAKSNLTSRVRREYQEMRKRK